MALFYDPIHIYLSHSLFSKIIFINVFLHLPTLLLLTLLSPLLLALPLLSFSHCLFPFHVIKIFIPIQM